MLGCGIGACGRRGGGRSWQERMIGPRPGFGCAENRRTALRGIVHRLPHGVGRRHRREGARSVPAHGLGPRSFVEASLTDRVNYNSLIQVKGTEPDQLSLDLRRRTWGGARAGAGRKARPRRPTPHRARPPHRAAYPVHITLRAVRGAPYLRAERTFRLVREAIRASSRETFRVIHFSVQGDHVHLIAEADDAVALSSGARGLAIRVAK